MPYLVSVPPMFRQSGSWAPQSRGIGAAFEQTNNYDLFVFSPNLSEGNGDISFMRELVTLRNDLLANKYHQKGILSGTLEEAAAYIKADFERRPDKSTDSFGLVRRWEEDDKYDLIATATLFYEDHPTAAILPGAFEKLERIASEETEDPDFIEVGRLAFEGCDGVESRMLMEGLCAYVSGMNVARYAGEKNHVFICSNPEHSRTYQALFGMRPLDMSITDLAAYNGNPGLVTYANVDEMSASRKWQRSVKRTHDRFNLF